MSETNTLMTNATNNTDGAASTGATEATTTATAPAGSPQRAAWRPVRESLASRGRRHGSRGRMTVIATGRIQIEIGLAIFIAGQQPTEGQPAAADPQDSAEGNADGDQAKAGDEPVVPEKYEFKAPDGREFDQGVLEQFSEVAKELKLTQDGAQKVIDKLSNAIAEKQANTMKAASEQWIQSVNADKEIGGAKLNENLSVAKKALETFGTPELRTLLNESGLGTHPEIIRAFWRGERSS